MSRIALTGLAPPFRGGIAHYTLHLAHALADHGRVRVFAWRRQYPRLLFPGTTQHDADPLPLPVQAVACLDPTGPWSWAETAERLERFGADMLVHQWWHPWFAPATWTLLRKARRARIPVTAICHNVRPHEGVPGAVAAAREALAPAGRIVVHGEHDARAARGLWPGADVVVHPHPPYHAFERDLPDRARARRTLGIEGGGPVALFFGYVRAYKGLADLVQAWPRVVARRPDARLVVAGEFYEDRAEHERRVRDLGIEASVILGDGFVPNALVGAWLRAADVVVLPYRSATGSGILPTALAAGVPVVATRVGDLPDAMVDGRDGRLVPPRDPEALARAVVDVLERPPDPAAMSRSARARGWPGLAIAALWGASAAP